MKDYQLSKFNLEEFFEELQEELKESLTLVVTTQNGNTGKWGMARLWRSWMASTAKNMAAAGCCMPIIIQPNGRNVGKRAFNENDAHELFTNKWLGCDESGVRLSWAKKSHNGMRAATKGERFHAMRQHEAWCVDQGIILFKPRDSQYQELLEEENK